MPDVLLVGLRCTAETEKEASDRVWFAVLPGCRYRRSCGLSGRHRPGHCVAVLAFHRYSFCCSSVESPIGYAV